MLNDLFEISEKGGCYWVKPVAAKERELYVIECHSKADAVRVVLLGKTPLEAPEHFTRKADLKPGTAVYIPKV